MTVRYLAVPALPAEQQDLEINPGYGPLGWVVVSGPYESHVQFGDGYMSERVAKARAAALNAGRPATDIPNDSEED